MVISMPDHRVEQYKLPLPSFRAAGFRAFRDLRLPELGRINLIVGKNNVGKTSLLEALHVYASGADSGVVGDILVSREEVPSSMSSRRRMGPDALGVAVDRLFHSPIAGHAGTFSLGPLNGDARELIATRGWVEVQSSVDTGDPQLRFSALEPEDLLNERQRAIRIEQGGGLVRVLRDERLFYLRRSPTPVGRLFPSTYVPSSGLGAMDVASNWDNIALTDAEELVSEALRIIAPDVERLSLIGNAEGGGDRTVMIRLRGRRSPVPLRSMGEGMNRLLSISLALVNTRDGLLQFDEVENGIHFSVQPDMWRLIFEAAERLNVQVFATTHSWDCIQAFQEVATSEPGIEGTLYRLENDGSEVRTVRLDERELAIATKHQIEIR
jgi:predicted ATPase